MKLRFVRHILAKDILRLWWTVALTLVLLFRLTYLDCWRGGMTPGAEEGWLNILLPLAWSFLIGLAILEDAPTGDSPFWLTVPCRWPPLLTAKVAFIAIFIHAPYFVACAVILHARGFAPMDHFSTLFYKQVALLVLTLSAVALAALAGNITRFIAIAIVFAAALGTPSIRPQGAATQTVRDILAFCIVTAAALSITIAQYARFRPIAGRATAVACFAIAGTVWWLPFGYFRNLQAAMPPQPAAEGLAIRLSGDPGLLAEVRKKYAFGRNTVTVAVPITVTGMATGSQAHFRQMEIHLMGPSGREYPTSSMQRVSSFALCCEDEMSSWQILIIDKSVYAQIDSPVTVRGRMIVASYRAPMSVGSGARVAGLGSCSSHITGYGADPQTLQVDCESPRPLPRTWIRISDAANGREWTGGLGDAATYLTYPTATWLSPVYRGDAFFPLTDEATYERGYGAQWQVPREEIRAVTIFIAPEVPEDGGAIDYELPDIRLSQYVVTR